MCTSPLECFCWCCAWSSVFCDMWTFFFIRILWVLVCKLCFVHSLAGPAHTIHSGTAHRQSPGQEQEPPDGETVQQGHFQLFECWRFSILIFILTNVWVSLNKASSLLFYPPAQDGPSHQHLLQRSEASLAAGQRGRGAAGGAERARHVWHGGLLDHLGEGEQSPRGEGFLWVKVHPV